MLRKGVQVIGSRITIASLRIAQVGGRRRVVIGIPAHGRNTGRCARRVATTFCPNTFLDSSNQSEIRNEIGCYRLPQPPLHTELSERGHTAPRPHSVQSAVSCLCGAPHMSYESITWSYTLNTLYVSSAGSTHSPHRASLHGAPKQGQQTDSKPETDIFECALLTSCLRPVVIGVQRAPVSRQRHPRPWLWQRPSTRRQAASGP